MSIDEQLIDASYVDWQPGMPPKDREAQYIVWMVGPGRKKRNLSVYSVMKVSNGFMATVEGHFASDYLDSDTRIVAWAPACSGPSWLNEET